MEFGVGSLLTPSFMALDLGLLEDDMGRYPKDSFGNLYWFSNGDTKTIAKSCASKRPLPMTPSDFDKMMDALGDAPAKQSAADKLRSRLIDTWGRIKPKDRIEFVREHRAEIEAALAALDAANQSGGGIVSIDPRQADLIDFLSGGAS